MGIRVEDFLDRYFSSDELKGLLEDIGHPVSGTKKERIDRILKHWNLHNRDWYELLDFLDWYTLSQICDDFNIPYSEYAKEETLSNKIEENWVIDFRKKERSSILKESNEKPSIHIRDINIDSHDKIETKTDKKSNSISKAHLVVAIIGIVVIIGIAIFTNYDFEKDVDSTDTVETDVGNVPIPQSIRDTEEAKTYPPIGDTIIDNTFVSNSYGFVISIPNDNWDINYEPYNFPTGNFEVFVSITNQDGSENISVGKIENIPEGYEFLMESGIKNNILSSNGNNFKEYHVESKDSKVYSYNYNSCHEDGCYDFFNLQILKVVDSDLYRIIAISEITDKTTESFIMSSDMYEIINSFKII